MTEAYLRIQRLMGTVWDGIAQSCLLAKMKTDYES